MSMSKLNICPDGHATLTFGSGDYYVFCNACGRKWAMMGSGPEYGLDKDGHWIGADPGQSSGRHSGETRVRQKTSFDKRIEPV